jgi:hypothetical protein
VEGEENWHETIGEWIERASRIVVLVPPAELGSGLLWELEHIAQPEFIDKVVLVVPPIPEAEVRQRWFLFTAGVRSLTGLSKVDVAASHQARVLICPNREQWYAVTAPSKTEWSYRAALDWAVEAGPALAVTPAAERPAEEAGAPARVSIPAETPRRVVPQKLAWFVAASLCIVATIGAGVWAAALDNPVSLQVPVSIGPFVRLQGGQAEQLVSADAAVMTTETGNPTVGGAYGLDGQWALIVLATAAPRPSAVEVLQGAEQSAIDRGRQVGTSVSFTQPESVLSKSTQYICVLMTTQGASEAETSERVCTWNDDRTDGVVFEDPALAEFRAAELSHQLIVR